MLILRNMDGPLFQMFWKQNLFSKYLKQYPWCCHARILKTGLFKIFEKQVMFLKVSIIIFSNNHHLIRDANYHRTKMLADVRLVSSFGSILRIPHPSISSNAYTSRFRSIFENSLNCKQIIGTHRRSTSHAARSSPMPYTEKKQTNRQSDSPVTHINIFCEYIYFLANSAL